MSSHSKYIVGPVYDWVFFLLPPAVALVAGIMISGSSLSNEVFTAFGRDTTAIEVGLGIVIHAHLAAVLFRSHGNPAIFTRHPFRFVAVPLVLWLGITVSAWVAATAVIVATFWDVWHSGAQTFGFARIYDRNAGADGGKGARRLELWANQAMYIGPILAGVTLFDHLDVFEGYADLGALLFADVPYRAASWQTTFRWLVIAAGSAVIVAYVVLHWRRKRAGHAVSGLKIYLVASTGLCSIYSWGLNSWGEAFFIMNLFHAVQYLGLVWASEGRRTNAVVRKLHLPQTRWTQLVIYLVLIGGYGTVAQLVPSSGAIWSLTIVVSLMHFWYDGFVWSVRQGQV